MKPNAACKLDMLDNLNKGRYGNFLATYPYPLVHTFPAKNWYTIRSKERDSPYFVSTVLGHDVKVTLQRLYQAGAPGSSLYVQDIPDPLCVRRIQGEAARTPGYHLHYSIHPAANLRDALTRPDFSLATGVVEGIMVRETVLFYGGEEAWGDLEDVLGQYPDHVIEFTVFSRPVGRMNRHLVVWEARMY